MTVKRPQHREKVPNAPGIYRSRSGRYAFNYRDSDGVTRWRFGISSLEAAQRARDEIFALAERAIRIPGSQVRVDRLAAHWLDSVRRKVERGERSARTHARYEEVVRSHLAPRFGDQRVR